ncbi:MAG TPA: HEAT repeat domain-containing protein [Bryobacteraceae bacterium]|nr:HEAT repeat domain-containing protein [Bryobacteraceae bacterium]
MNCESVSKSLPMFLYGELSLDQEQALQDHVDGCEACRKAFETEKLIHAALDEREAEVPPALLARCRRDFGDRLDTLTPHRAGWLAAAKEFFGAGRSWAAAVRPAGAVALVALGFFGARWTSTQPAAIAPGPADPMVTRVRYLQPEPSGQVRLMVEETRQRYVTGDPQEGPIQQLLLAAARESSDPGVRADSVEILKDRAASNEIRDALIYALRSDANAGIRLRALDGLKSYAADPQVRRALAQALLTDDNPGVRTQAIDLLVQNRRDEALVGVLQELLQTESNSYVRLRSERALKDMNASVGTF